MSFDTPSQGNANLDSGAGRWARRRLTGMVLVAPIGLALAIAGGPHLYRALGAETSCVVLALTVATSFYDFFRQGLALPLDEPRRPAAAVGLAVSTCVFGALFALPLALTTHFWVRDLPGGFQWPLFFVVWNVAYFVAQGGSPNGGPALAAGATVIFLIWWPTDFRGMWLCVLPLLSGHVFAPVRPPELSWAFAMAKSQRVRAMSLAFLPLVFVLLHHRDGTMVLAAVLISGICYMHLAELGTQLMAHRVGVMVGFGRRLAWTPLLAATPVGRWAAEAALRDPVVAAAGVVVAALASRQTLRIARVTRLPLNTALYVVRPLSWLTGYGLFPFYVCAVAWPNHRLTVLVIAGAVVAVGQELAKSPWLDMQARLPEIMVLLSLSPENRMRSLSLWMRERLLVPRRPDFELVRALTGKARTVASSGRAAVERLVPVLRTPGDAAEAEQWLALAMEVIVLVEAVLPGLHQARREQLEAELAIQKASVIHARASVCQTLHRLDEAALLWGVAENLWEDAGVPHNATTARCNSASILLRMGNTDAALEVAEEVLAAPRLNGLHKNMMLITIGQIRGLQGDVEGWEAYLAAAQAVPLTAADLRESQRAARVVFGRVANPYFPAWLMRRFASDMLSGLQFLAGRRVGVVVPFRRMRTLNASRDLLMKAYALAAAHKPQQAAKTALKALRHAQATGQLSHEANILDFLVVTTPVEAAGEKLDYVYQALDARERARSRLILEGSKITIGGVSLETLHEQGMAALLADRERPEHPDQAERPGWRTEAFDLTERVRNRRLLELIAGNARATSDGPLVQRERQEYQHHADDLARIAQGDITAILRYNEHLKTLDGTWRELDADPALRDYAHLRRGAPFDYQAIRALLGDRGDDAVPQSGEHDELSGV